VLDLTRRRGPTANTAASAVAYPSPCGASRRESQLGSMPVCDGPDWARLEVRMLVLAAAILPSVAVGGFVMASDVHAALVTADGVLGPHGRGRVACAHCRADKVEAILAVYLVDAGLAVDAATVGLTLRSWPGHHELSQTCVALTSAACFWRSRLDECPASSDVPSWGKRATALDDGSARPRWSAAAGWPLLAAVPALGIGGWRR